MEKCECCNIKRRGIYAPVIRRPKMNNFLLCSKCENDLWLLTFGNRYGIREIKPDWALLLKNAKKT